MPSLQLNIPALSADGVLPPYLGNDATINAAMSPYEAALDQIASRFCYSEGRKEIFRGFLAYRTELAKTGISTGFQWLSGSFFEDIESIERRSPRDIDVVTFLHRPKAFVEDHLWQGFVGANQGLLLDRKVVKDRYKCDAYFVDLSVNPEAVVSLARYWFGLFSHRRDGLWKGMIQVPVAVTDGDAQSSRIVGA